MLPSNESRCTGERDGTACAVRATCLRYTEPVTAESPLMAPPRMIPSRPTLSDHLACSMRLPAPVDGAATE